MVTNSFDNEEVVLREVECGHLFKGFVARPPAKSNSFIAKNERK